MKRMPPIADSIKDLAKKNFEICVFYGTKNVCSLLDSK